jgi:hypothetical protein
VAVQRPAAVPASSSHHCYCHCRRPEQRGVTIALVYGEQCVYTVLASSTLQCDVEELQERAPPT